MSSVTPAGVPIAIPAPTGAAVIATVTGRDLLDELGALRESVTTLTATVNTIPVTVQDHETRLRGLERWRWMGTGIAAFLSAAISSGAVGLIVTATAHHH
jgi:hypothetical protein